MSPQLQFNFDNSYARNLEGLFSYCEAESAVSPKWLQLNHILAEELGLDPAALDSKEGLAIFSGNTKAEGSQPIAQAYAGHQFGGFSPQLGDGRALLLGEVIDTKKQRRDIQLKGSGRTPFSRGGDGKAAVGPVLREYLIGEAMHALGIPTTRGLAAVSTGAKVFRETILPGAILTRVAASHLRIGTFQFVGSRLDEKKVRKLADYAMERHYPETIQRKNPYLDFFAAVADMQASLVSRWMSIGFIHGVMNTDNMTISGETIDYGPCAFMDSYNPNTVFSSIDRGGRYAYVNQPKILIWNLARFAETLIPLVDPNREKAVESLTEIIEGTEPLYESYWLSRMKSKIGLSTEDSFDKQLVHDFLKIMEGADFTLVFRQLSQALLGETGPILNLLKEPNAFNNWENRWRKRIENEGVPLKTIAQAMDKVNPIYIPRNHKVEEALFAAAYEENITPFSKLLTALNRPFEKVVGNEAYAEPAPETNIPYKTFCGT